MKKCYLVAMAPILLAACSTSPDPLTLNELTVSADDRLERRTAGQEKVAQPIDLYEAMARALKYNLDHKVEAMETVLRSRELSDARFDLLPDVVARAGYAGRDNFSGASSSRILSDRAIGEQSLVASTSSERFVVSSDLRVSWDVLDFGLSYVRAKQQADEVLIAEERRRAVANRIIEDVRTAYWRAVTAERLINRLRSLDTDVDSALSSSAALYERGRASPISALTYRRELLSIKQEIQSLQEDLAVARQQLAALMNLKPGDPFKLVLPARDKFLVDFTMPADAMVRKALAYRPEIREISYQQRINEKEATAALLNLLPSLRAFGGFNYDSNEFLFNNHWAGWGAEASKNLVEAFRYPSRRKVIKAQGALLDQRSLALTMAVVTQVHVSRTRFELAKRRLETMRDFHQTQATITEQIKAGVKARRISRQTGIREQMNNIVAEARYDIALSNLHNSFANLHAAMGLDPLKEDVAADLSVEELSGQLREIWRERGDIVIAEADPVAKKIAQVSHSQKK